MDISNSKKCGIGIDISKGHSTVSAYAGKNINLNCPRAMEFKHTKTDLKNLIDFLKGLNFPIRIVLEETGVYSSPIIKVLKENDLPITVVNPVIIKRFSYNPIRKVKSDKADAQKIAHYAYMYFEELEDYKDEDELRYNLKLLNRARETSLKQQTMNKNSLISILDKTYPGINKLFPSQMRDDGTQKWVDFVSTFWHCECITKQNFNTFLNRYERWCERHHYHFSEEKAREIYEFSQELVPTMNRDKVSKDIFKFHLNRLKDSMKQTTSALNQMNDIAENLPEYQTVLSMNGVGRRLAPQLIAEIGDIRRFKNRRSLVAFAGIDPGVNQSGDYNQISNACTRSGNTYLRKTLYLVIDNIIMRKPNDPIYDFLIKKKEEGKPTKVLKIAGCNKFLRIYYGKVKEFFKSEYIS